jgi:gamma-glutamyltranspeptidase/glutathione hydrolase
VLAPSSVVAGPPGSAAIAAGSVATAQAGAEILAAGGNAVDGILAAAFAAAVSEPGLSSLGGGGFCMVSFPPHPIRVYDFFVNAPGLGLRSWDRVSMESVLVQFRQTTQIFHAGWGSVAVPGSFSGYLQLHRDFGSRPLREIVRPAIAIADRGTVVEPVTALDFELVGAALGCTTAGRDLYFTGDRPKRVGEMLRNPQYGALLRALVDGEVHGAADPSYVRALVQAMAEHGGAVTQQDLDAFEAIQRPPLVMQRGEARILSNPPPSYGASIVRHALTDLGREPDWPEVAHALEHAVATQRRQDAEGGSHVPTGTTHVSVVDAAGGMAALTMSIGTGSGAVVPGWGVQLNNMAGEEDLNPGGLHALPPGTRMGSMMAPALIEGADGSRTVFGTGGSERIRSTTTCLLIRLIDQGMSLAEAVDAPRMHPAPDGVIQLEPGIDANFTQPVQRWLERDFYFGGVHAVQVATNGEVHAVGDGRRGGHAIVMSGPDA